MRLLLPRFTGAEPTRLLKLRNDGSVPPEKGVPKRLPKGTRTVQNTVFRVESVQRRHPHRTLWTQ